MIYKQIRKSLGEEKGQSLVEVLVALGVGAILIGSATVGVSFMLQSSTAGENLQIVNALVKETSDKARVFGNARWSNINSLSTSTDYFLISSSTTFAAVQGKEGVIASDVTDGLVGKWGFDEETGEIAYDYSTYSNIGTLYNDPTRATSTCRIGNCLAFNGIDTYVNMGDPSDGSLDFGTGDFSLSGWFYISTFPDSWKSILNKGGSGAVGYGMELSYSNAVTCSLQASGGSNQHVSGSIPSLGSWHHGVCVFDRDDEVRVFLDGALVATSTYASGNTGSVSTNSYTFRVGQFGGGGWSFDGSIDEIRVYNQALSSDEVSRIYGSRIYERYFVVENACRTNDASSEISGVEPCSGGSLMDPSTKKVTSYVNWSTGSGTGETTLIDYLTRWENDVFWQTDWSGGSGSEGPVSDPDDTYASSTNIDLNSGSVRIHNL